MQLWDEVIRQAHVRVQTLLFLSLRALGIVGHSYAKMIRTK